ncbi:MAG TPA: CBS domain-containing protein [Polyangiaceae bacterium]|nr:CBS domain-containing protein [Polyangiaceae bacterium]
MQDVSDVRVRDVMERLVLWVLVDQTVSEAAALFADESIGGAPVCDPHGRVVGILTKTDVAECVAAHDTERLVGDVMNPEVISVNASDRLDRAVAVMAFEGVHRLIVLDDAHRLVGIVTPMDVLRELAGFGRRATRPPIAAPPPR